VNLKQQIAFVFIVTTVAVIFMYLNNYISRVAGEIEGLIFQGTIIGLIIKPKLLKVK